ncbi:MAG: DUF4382 domain-containing protein [Candidatus Micrarchaeota archaeon]|nr:DUF4382 domain-containing protein [Candidatus Micrarchaeota archaeon]
MASKTLYAVALVLVILAVVAVYFLSMGGLGSGMSRLAVQMTDPPNVPQGTQHLIVAYSSVQVHSTGNASQSGWINASGSGTVDLMALVNVSKTIASADVSSNSSINLVRFDITSAQIVVNNTTYNVTVPNSQVSVAVTGQQKVNSSSSAVLVDLFPTVNAHSGANSTTYVMAPAARAIVINSNSSVNINTNIGSVASIMGSIKARIGIGLGGGGNHNNGTTYGTSVNVRAGQRVSNFLVQGVDYNSGTVSGLLYVQYPVASNVGVNTTIHVNSTVGYACDNTEFKLTSIYSNNTAVFTPIANTSTYGGCPI